MVQLRPTTPWRLGPDSGERDRVDTLCHSDTLWAAVTSAMGRLGKREEWLAATAPKERPPEVRFSSCFPHLNGEPYVPPPRNLWPPVASARVRWKGAQFVPARVVEALLAERPPDEDAWTVDGVSQCLLAARAGAGPQGPFRVALRAAAAVDRISGSLADPHRTACLEFTAEAGLWAAAVFAGEAARDRWIEPVRAAFRLLGDSGLGGERSRGWGRFEIVGASEGSFPEMIVRRPPEAAQDPEVEPPPSETAYWMLSLFSPAPEDRVDWQRGCYTLVTRAGRVESAAGWGELKRPLRMVAEGSVLLASAPPVGLARDVAPEGFPHPVLRAGHAVSIPITWRGAA